ncbi:MAG TPA: dephospho-CoA kinase [Candidatus Eisenbacteria bacterium]|nr:dephospho-CoA kinase [Candidatus Eisenbacteria bacterium]
MLRIGVTGLMASGKSTVARRFEERGAVRIDGDALGWEALRIPAVRDRIAATFGAETIAPDGAVDRARLGAVVFADFAAMAKLDAIVQPPLLAMVRRSLDESVAPVVVLDAAMLASWGLDREMDGVVEVKAPEPLRIARLRAARGYGAEEAERRVRGQALPPLHAVKRHWVVVNDADAAALRARADQVWGEIVSLAATPEP